jgi:hypothetical protein
LAGSSSNLKKIPVFLSGIFLILFLVFDTWSDLLVLATLFVAGVCNCGADTLLTGQSTFAMCSSSVWKNFSFCTFPVKKRFISS